MIFICVRDLVSFFPDFFLYRKFENIFQVKKVNQAHHEIRDQKRNDHAKSNQKLKDLTSKEIDNLVNVRKIK